MNLKEYNKIQYIKYIHEKYDTAICFGSRLPSSGSLLEERNTFIIEDLVRMHPQRRNM
jgi:hypothetical protein